jgi:hypothetical protein
VRRGSAQMRTGKKARLQKREATCNLISMPELPDIAAYIGALEPRIVAQPIERVRLASAFLLWTAALCARCGE